MDLHYMKKLTTVIGLGLTLLTLAACQTTPRQYNGVTGFQIENKTATTATLAYTLAGRANRDLDENKLQRACQKTLNTTKQYKLNVLSVNEIANPNFAQKDPQGVQLGQSRTSFGLSKPHGDNITEFMATCQFLDARPRSLHVVRYTCS